MIEKLLEFRNKVKAKMPNFRTHDSHKKKRVNSETWRRPKGRQNKVRLNHKGYVRSPALGFSSPALVKGLSRNGLTQNSIKTMVDFTGLNNKKDGVIIYSKLGKVKKKEYVDYAIKNGFTILNLNVEKFNKSFEQFVSAKKTSKENSTKRKTIQEEKSKKAEVKKETKSEVKAEKTEEKSNEVKEEKPKAQKKKTAVDKKENKGGNE
jgi:large subunit ribosomal protein L32e